MKQKILLSLSVFMLLGVVTGCTKENQKPDATAKEILDPVNDLAGFLNGFDSTLYVLPENKNEVIKALNARLLEGNVYTMTASTIGSKKIPFTFKLKESTIPLILFYITDSDRQLLDLSADEDTSRASLIGRFRDSTGVFYRVYKNARCSEISKAIISDCREERIYSYDPIDSYTRTGKYIKHELQPLNHCLKGNDYCVEAIVVALVTKRYDDALCRNLIGTREAYNYSCLK